MHLRHQHPDPACSFQRPRPEPFTRPILENLSRHIRATETALRRWRCKICHERQRRSRILQLQNLSDRQLLDIGVERSEIAATVERILEQKRRLR